MFTRIVKWFSILALLLGLMLRSSAGFRIALQIEVCVAALVVVVQAMRIGKYMWGLGFIALSLTLQPRCARSVYTPAFLEFGMVQRRRISGLLAGTKVQADAFHPLDHRPDSGECIALNMRMGW